MPPKKGKKAGKAKATKPSPKKSPAKAADATDTTAETAPAKDTSKASPGSKRKHDGHGGSGPAPKKAKTKKLLSKADAKKKQVETYLIVRSKDLGIDVEPAPGHDVDDDAEDALDENTLERLRERCDDRLDVIEDAIRALGRSKYNDYVIPETKSGESRREKRQGAKEIDDTEEIEPIAFRRRVKKTKKFPDGIKYPSAEELGRLAGELSTELARRLERSRVQHPEDVSLFKYPSEKAKKAKKAAEAKGHEPDKTRALDKQWDQHGLSLSRLLDLYNRQGSEAQEVARTKLEEKCKKYGLSTTGSTWDLDLSVLLYELRSKQRLYGLSQQEIDDAISSLQGIQTPAEASEEAEELDDDDDDDKAGESFEDLDGSGTEPKGKGKGKGKGKVKGSDTATDKDKKKDGKKAEEKGGKGADKKGKAATKGATSSGRKTRSKKGPDLAYEEGKLALEKRITVDEGGQTQRFTQKNVSGTGNRCLWHAVQYIWLGRQLSTGANRYPVNGRVRQLWDAVMHPTAGTSNPARRARRALYEQLLENSNADDDADGNLEERLRSQRMGDLDMVQLIADALDVEIFVYAPQLDAQGNLASWNRLVRGRPHGAARQIHIANYMNARHWTALAPEGAITLPALTQAQREPIPGWNTYISPIDRLEPGADGNTDLRPTDKHDDPEDGHVANTAEEHEDEEMGDEKGDEKGDESGAADHEDGDHEDDDVPAGGHGGDDDEDGGASAPAAASSSHSKTSTSVAAKKSSSRKRSSSRSTSRSSPLSSAEKATRTPSRSPSNPQTSQKRARRRARSRSASKKRNAPKPNGVQKAPRSNRATSKKIHKKVKTLQEIFGNFMLAMPSPYAAAGPSQPPLLPPASLKA